MDLTRVGLVDVCVRSDTVDAQVSVFNNSNIIIFQEDDLVGVLNDRAGIWGKEVLNVFVAT